MCERTGFESAGEPFTLATDACANCNSGPGPDPTTDADGGPDGAATGNHAG